jgi:hypothetical protein
LSLSVQEGQTVEFQNCYADLERMVGVIICNVSGIDNYTDTGMFLTDYRAAINRQFEDEQVMEGDYSVDGIHIKSFLVTTPQMVQFKLICIGNGPAIAELSFFSAVSAYEDFVKSIESSIGSIKLIKGGDVN